SWVSAIGAARRMVSANSARQTTRSARRPAETVATLSPAVMRRTIGGFAQKESAGSAHAAAAGAAAALPSCPEQGAQGRLATRGRRRRRFAFVPGVANGRPLRHYGLK